MKAKHFSHGFSLIEILVAMTILSVILSMVYTILESTLSSQRLVQREIALDRTADQLLNLIIHDLQSAYIYQLDGVCFLGRSQAPGDRIDFVTNTDSLLGNESVKSDLCEVGYYIKNNPEEPGAYKLIRREDFFLDDNLIEGGFYIKMYDRVADFQVRYIDSKGAFKKTWNNKEDQGLPKAVLVTLALRSAPRGSDPEDLNKDLRYYKAYIPLMVSSKLPKPPKKPQPGEETKQD